MANETSASSDVEKQIELRLRSHVAALSGSIGPRTLENPQSIVATLDYLRRQFQSIGHRMTEETYPVDTVEATNLVINVAGQNEDAAVVLLGAHYDTVAGTPGADDNASAVAVLLEVSRLLVNHPGRRTARYVAFACEELPHGPAGTMGSQHHAAGCRRRGEVIEAMLCLEMVGYYSERRGSQRVPAAIPRWLHPFFPKRGNFLAAVGNLQTIGLNFRFRRAFRRGTRSLRLFSINLPEKIRDIRRSDHSSFWDQGYPAIMLTDTSYLRNDNYHRPTDTPDTLDYQRMTQVTLGVASAMKALLGSKV